MIGQTLRNRYQVDVKVGSGAMGEVYRAKDLQTGDVVALKRIAPELAAQDIYRKRFQREVAALKKLNHPYIIGYVDAFMIDGALYLVMEYIGGGTLAQLIQNRQMLPDGLFKRIALNLLDALASAHEAGVVHRDLKPANILITATGDPKIADFGLVRVEDFSTMTRTGAAMGTLTYMPPEAFDTLTKQDHRGDIWAIGIILYEMLTGRQPFVAKTHTQAVAAILLEQPPAITLVRKDIPAAWNSIIMSCLQKAPTDRYQSVRDLQDDLRADRCRYEVSVELFKPENASSPVIEPDSIYDPQDAPAIIPPDDTDFGTLPPEDAGQGYQFKFIQAENQPAKAMIRAELQPAASAIRPLPPRQNPPRGVPIKGAKLEEQTVTPALMIVGSLFLWPGMIGVLLAAMMGVVISTSAGDSFKITAQQLLVFQTLAVLVLVIGLVLEIPDAPLLQKMLNSGMILWVIGVWLVCFAGLFFTPGFFASLVASMFYGAFIVMYFEAKKL